MSLDALLDRSEDLAKGWLLALLEQAPLDDAPRILATDLTREGPRVCEAVLRAIGSDADERRLEPEGPLAPLAARVGELAGAAGPRDTAQAVDALQGVDVGRPCGPSCGIPTRSSSPSWPSVWRR